MFFMQKATGQFRRGDFSEICLRVSYVLPSAYVYHALQADLSRLWLMLATYLCENLKTTYTDYFFLCTHECPLLL